MGVSEQSSRQHSRNNSAGGPVGNTAPVGVVPSSGSNPTVRSSAASALDGSFDGGGDSEDESDGYTVINPEETWGATGEVLQIKARRPNRHSLGFRFVGGCDRKYGAAFVTQVQSSSASDLLVGDRILVANGAGYCVYLMRFA